MPRTLPKTEDVPGGARWGWPAAGTALLLVVLGLSACRSGAAGAPPTTTTTPAPRSPAAAAPGATGTVRAAAPTAQGGLGPPPAVSPLPVRGSCTPLAESAASLAALPVDATIPGTTVTVREVRAGTLPAPPRGQPVAAGTLVLLASPHAAPAAGTSPSLVAPPLLGAPDAAWYMTTCPLPPVVAFYTTVLHQASWAGAFSAPAPSASPSLIRDGSFQTATAAGQVVAFIELARLPATGATASRTAVELLSQRLLPGGAGGTSGAVSATTSAAVSSAAANGSAPLSAGSSSGGGSVSTVSAGTVPAIPPTVAPTTVAPSSATVQPVAVPTSAPVPAVTSGAAAGPTLAPPLPTTAAPAAVPTAPPAAATSVLPAVPTVAPPAGPTSVAAPPTPLPAANPLPAVSPVAPPPIPTVVVPTQATTTS